MTGSSDELNNEIDDEQLTDDDDDSEEGFSIVDEQQQTSSDVKKVVASKKQKNERQPNKTKKEAPLEDYLQLEQKLREERSAKKLVPVEILRKEEEQAMRERLRRERKDPKLLLYGRPRQKKPESESVFSDADFQAVKKGKGKSSALSSRVKRVR